MIVRNWEDAAIKGEPQARYNLAYYEEVIGNIERAVKHLIIAANLGYEETMKELWRHHSARNVTIESLDLDSTLGPVCY